MCDNALSVSCIERMIDFSMYIDTLSMGLSVVYFKGSHVEFSKL